MDDGVIGSVIDGALWSEAGESLLADAIRLRRAIHQEPELGLHCPKTSEKIKQALAGLPLEIREGPSTTGLVAILRGSDNGRTVLLRGDMDALPLTEDAPVDYRSLFKGVMHACGHDAHVAMLVGAAKALCAQRDRLAGTVMFMFQPGEEGWHGARYMIEDGLLDDPAPDAAFALHIAPNLSRGLITSRAGPMLASSDSVDIIVRGRGGHASAPHVALDPIPVACEIVTALQVFVTRQISAFTPAVLTIAKIDAGTTYNVIPETATMLGTLRTLSEQSRSAMHEGIEQVARGIGIAHGVEVEVEITEGFPVMACDERIVRLVEHTARTAFGDAAWLPMPTPAMGAEDFAYVLNRTPGAMAFLGAKGGEGWDLSCCTLHSNRMMLDDTAMARGVAMHCAFAQAFLNGDEVV
jgi:amidohydrolase